MDIQFRVFGPFLEKQAENGGTGNVTWIHFLARLAISAVFGLFSGKQAKNGKQLLVTVEYHYLLQDYLRIWVASA